MSQSHLRAATDQTVACSQSVPFDITRLGRAKGAYTTRYVTRLLNEYTEPLQLLTGADVVPRSGDVVLARVEKLGQHRALMSADGRRTTMYPGDEVLVAYGNRYAPDQFEAEIPADLGPAQLVAAGGVISRVESAHAAMAAATTLEPVGLVADDRGVLTLERCAPLQLGPRRVLAAQDEPTQRPTVIAVVGTSMNAGKTTTMTAIVRGLTARGLRVGAVKVTGTGAPGDGMMYLDGGAVRAIDFTDFGFASTYLLPPYTVRALLAASVAELAGSAVDAVVVEVADGLLQLETAALITDPLFSEMVDRVVFAAGDALSGVAGDELLRRWGVGAVAISGVVTASPLASRELAARVQTPVVSNDELAGDAAADLLGLAGGASCHVAS